MNKLSYIIYICLLFPFMAVADEKPTPGFDCTKAETNCEIIICNSNDLSILDYEMNKIYRSLIDKGLYDVVKKQKNWLELRNKCEGSMSPEICLSQTYKERLKELIDMHIEANQPRLAIDHQPLYPLGLSVEGIKVNQRSIEYLILVVKYIYGVITTKYYSGNFEEGRLVLNELISWHQVEDDGEGAESGDRNCSEIAEAYFYNTQ